MAVTSAAAHALKQTSADELIQKIVDHAALLDTEITLLANHLHTVGSYDMTPLKALMTKSTGMCSKKTAIRTDIIAKLRAALLTSGADVPADLVKNFYEHEKAAVTASLSKAAASPSQKGDELSCPYTLCPIRDAELVFLVSKEGGEQKRTIYPVSRQGFSEALLLEAKGKQQDESKITPTIPTLSPPDNEAESLIIYANLTPDLQAKLKTAATGDDASAALNQLFKESLGPHCSNYQNYLTDQHSIVKNLIATKVSAPNMELLHHLAKDFDVLIPQLKQWRVEYSRDNKDIDEWATAWASFFDELIEFIQAQPKTLEHEAFMELMSQPLEGGACAGTSLWYFIARDSEAQDFLVEMLDKNPDLPILDALSRRLTESADGYDGTSGLYYLAKNELAIWWINAHADHLLQQASFHEAMSQLMPQNSEEATNMSGWTWAASVNQAAITPLLPQLLTCPSFIDAMSADLSEDIEDVDCASGFSYLFMAETADRKRIFHIFEKHPTLLQNQSFLAAMERDGWQKLIGEDSSLRRKVSNWVQEKDKPLFESLLEADLLSIVPPTRAASEEPVEADERPKKRERDDATASHLDRLVQVSEWREDPILLPGVFGNRDGRAGRASSLPPSIGPQRSP